MATRAASAAAKAGGLVALAAPRNRPNCRRTMLPASGSSGRRIEDCEPSEPESCFFKWHMRQPYLSWDTLPGLFLDFLLDQFAARLLSKVLRCIVETAPDRIHVKGTAATDTDPTEIVGFFFCVSLLLKTCQPRGCAVAYIAPDATQPHITNPAANYLPIFKSCRVEILFTTPLLSFAHASFKYIYNLHVWGVDYAGLLPHPHVLSTSPKAKLQTHPHIHNTIIKPG
ncbi:hypothetical protein QBC39DRAFT_147222 [Podospora conica]|nr:hypothetical protein QBC39DRAFT_147222 [Schizothecium conicum]